MKKLIIIIYVLAAIEGTLRLYGDRVEVWYPNEVFYDYMVTRAEADRIYTEGKDRLERNGDPCLDYEWRWIWE